MWLINERQLMLESLDPKRPKTFCFCSQFLSKLLENGGFDYSRVKNWTDRAGFNVFEHGKLIIPGIYTTLFMHLSNSCDRGAVL